MSKLSALKHYQRILAQWPVDLLRPELSFQRLIQTRIHRQSPGSSQDFTEHKLGPGKAETSATQRKRLDEALELGQVNVLYSFLEDRYTKKYPLSERLMRPASNPAYYEKLIKELEEAPRRSWLGNTLNRWKGFLRFS